jgi:hypothetical protein
MAMAMFQDHNVLLLLKLCSLEGILASIICGDILILVLLTM